MRPLTRYVVHRRPTIGAIPLDADLLGHIDARDRDHARDIVRAQWPRESTVIQPARTAMTVPHAVAPKPRPDYAAISRWNKRRRA